MRENILAKDGKLVYKTRGVSMEPMLRQKRDLVVIQSPQPKLKPLEFGKHRFQAVFLF